MTDAQITTTWVGHEYGWDFVSQVDWDMMLQNYDCLLNVWAFPEDFPHANPARVEERIRQFDEFFASYMPKAA